MIICFPHKPGSGGPGSFQTRFEKSLKDEAWEIQYKDFSRIPDVIFVVGGTRHFLWLIKMKMKGIPIVYRLDGISWLHRKNKVDLKLFLKVEYRNFLNKLIHAFIADKIIYQSFFVKEWWNRSGYKKRKESSIIFNGVELPIFLSQNKNNSVSLVVVEGNIDYSPYAVDLLNDLVGKLKNNISIKVYGCFRYKENQQKISSDISYCGYVQRENINDVMLGSIYLSLDINPACPNTVIEALACGAPVVAFDTGSLKELVPPEAGIIVPYGSDPWELAYPDVDALAKAILKVKENYAWYSANARKVAEERYSIEDMTEKYLNVIYKVIKK